MATWGESRPKSYVCYLCGQQFGSASLHIHIPQCATKFLQQQEQLPKNARKPLPPPPPSLPPTAAGLPTKTSDIQRFNEQQFEAYNSASLTRCSGCGRTFNPEAYMRHVNTCKGNLGSSDGSAGGSIKAGSIGKGATGMRSSTSGSGRGGSRSASGSAIGGGKVSTTPAGSKSSGGDGGGSAAQGSAGSSGPFSFSKPRALICYLCGRGFGSASLPIHIPQCEQIFQERESTKPRGEPRRALQLRPARIAHIGSGTCTFPKDAAGIDAFNEEMFQTFNCSALVPCQHCGRTFLPEALAHHAQHCTEDAPMVRSGGGGGGGLGAAGSAGVGGSCLSMPDGAIIRSGMQGSSALVS